VGRQKESDHLKDFVRDETIILEGMVEKQVRIMDAFHLCQERGQWLVLAYTLKQFGSFQNTPNICIYVTFPVGPIPF
jgi:hypothetical protein